MPTIDVHLNLAGNGAGDSGCYASAAFIRRYTIKFLRWKFGISKQQMQTSFDRDWVALAAKTVNESRVDYGVMLGFDAVYDLDTGAFDQKRTQMYVPLEWVFEACEAHQALLPCPSVNPYRVDALERLDECHAKGAVAIKWLPPAMGIDPSDEKLLPFYERIKTYGIPILSHTAGERTFATVGAGFGDLKRLEFPLEVGVKIIAAHSSTRPLASFEPDRFALLLEYLERYPNLWVDNSGITNPSRFHHLGRLAGNELIRSRTLYGSDWPIPCNAFYYLPKLGLSQVRALERIPSEIDRDIAIKRLYGYEDDTLTRANDVLAHLDRWL